MIIIATLMILIFIVLPLSVAIYSSRKHIKRDIEELKIIDKLKGSDNLT
jgi:hypothetical protein